MKLALTLRSPFAPPPLAHRTQPSFLFPCQLEAVCRLCLHPSQDWCPSLLPARTSSHTPCPRGVPDAFFAVFSAQRLITLRCSVLPPSSSLSS
eukprot:855679-Pleurochrysis_carterae.AAC.1